MNLYRIKKTLGVKTLPRGKPRIIFTFSALGIIAIAVLTMNIFTGSADIPFAQTLKILFSFGKSHSPYADILLKIRIPRAFAALILGGALALSGYLLQTFFHNPIAGPFVLGVSSGAKLTVALVMILVIGQRNTVGSAVMIFAAFTGSMITLGIVLAISRRIKRMSLLVVCGVMIGYICSAITDFAVTFADNSDIVNLHNWSMGTFSGTTGENVAVMSAVVAPACVCTFFLSKPISAYRLGDGYAQSMGVNVRMLRIMLILLSGLLAACVTAFAGPVSFVGIAVPHIVRVIFRTSKPIIMIPACFIGGSIFCMLCDMAARTAFAPTEMSISTVTAIFGAPVVIAVMLQRKRGEI